MMIEYHFNFSEIADIVDFYQQCRQQWHLPECFGDNLDALWDVLTSGGVALPAILHVTHLYEREDAEQFRNLISLLYKAEIELDGELVVRVA